MKKRVLISTVAVLIILGCVIFFLCKNIGGNEKDSQKLMDSEVVLASSKEGYNSIVVYQKKNILVVSAKSEAAFFEGTQYEVETQGNVDSNNIEILWRTLGGSTEKTEDNDLIIAEVKILENGSGQGLSGVPPVLWYFSLFLQIFPALLQ